MNMVEVQDQLRKLTEIRSHTTIVLDALDECDKSTRIELVNFLNDLAKGSSRLIKIFVASRPDLDLRIEFKTGLNVEIRAHDNGEDIDMYVEDAITNINGPLFWRKGITNELRETVCRTLVSEADGM